MNDRAVLLVIAVTGWLTGGCDEPLKSVELVAEPRLLGGRVEVTGDESRAAPAPGESASATFLIAAPALQPSLGFAFAVCSAAPHQGSRPACAEAPFARVSSAGAQTDPPRIAFEVPAELDPRGRLAVLGIVCPDGEASADGQSCNGPDSGTPLALELELSREGDVNENPELQPESIRFDGAAWPELPPVDGDCAELGFVEVAAGSKHLITVALDEGDRDPLPRPSKLDPSRESLQLSHFTTAGDLTRAFDTIAWDSAQLEREVSWTAPKSPGLVRFWLVLRDFRGGSAFTERAVCVQ